jgi:hypothetical protein
MLGFVFAVGFKARLAVGAGGGTAAGVEVEQVKDVAGIPAVRLPVLEGETPEEED